MSSFYYKAAELVADKKVTRNNNYKTSMCKNLMNCVFGEKCRFAHSKEELRKARCMYGVNCKNHFCTYEHSADETEQEEFLKKLEEQKLQEEALIAEEEKKREEQERKRLEEYNQTQKYWEDNRDKFIVNFDESDDEGEYESDDEEDEGEKEEKKEEIDALSDRLENTSIVDDELVQKTVISQIIHPKNEKNIKKYIMSYMELPNEGDSIKYADKTKKPVTLNLTNLEIDRLMFIMKYLEYEQK
jgi:hypothetical protein